MGDHRVRALAAGGTIRALAAVTTDLVEEARRRHDTAPTATAALGRTLTAALLLATTIKRDEKLSLELSGDGPLKSVVADATPDGLVRGYVGRPATDLPPRDGKLDVGGALGKGVLCVMRVPVAGENLYRSIVPLVSGEVGVDVAQYLLSSEQIPSAVGVGVFVDRDGRVAAAGGYLIQGMPGADPETLDRIATTVESAPSPTDLVRAGCDASAMLRRLLGDLDMHELEARPVAFGCPCSRERVKTAVVALGRLSIEHILANEKRVDATCEFCREEYVVGEAELRELLG